MRIALAILLPLLASSLPLSKSRIDPSHEALQYVGRWDFQNKSAPAFQWSGSSISFTLQCNSASKFSATFDTHDTYTKFGVYLNEGSTDNITVPYQLVKPGSSVIKASVPQGKTTVTIMKITEDLKADPAQGSSAMLQEPCVFHGLAIDTETCTISGVPQKERRMQFIGDSITCGFGNQLFGTPSDDVKSAECLAEAAVTAAPTNIIGKMLYELEDTHQSWSLQLARQFEAEAHVQCLSGIGMCKNDIGIASHSDFNMTYFVDRTLPFTARTASNMWDYSLFQPDLLVINLGTNDYIASTGVIAPTYASFQAHYVTFVQQIMANYEKSRTKILLACGPMTNRQCPYVEAAANLLANDFQAGYVNVTLTKSCSGCAGHPTQAEDTAMVGLMTSAVKTLTGW